MATQGLPLPVKIHATITLGLGVGLTFFPATIIRSAPFVSLSRFFNVAAPALAGVAGDALARSEEQSWTTIGLLLTAIGSIYLPHWNRTQRGFVDSGIKGRLVIAGLAAMLWVAKPNSRDLFKVAIMVEDGLAALLVGWSLGTFG